ncbi:MAG: OmpA family protein, partial [Planctomycetota bacterium]|nr:OmpA family protein [Planctomycetota bacterium]
MKPSDTAHRRRPVANAAKTALLAALCLPGLTSCVTESQMRLAIEDRDREISTLRTDKTELQERLDLLSYEKEDLRVKLENAQASLASSTQVPASFGEGSGYVAFPELEEMGITTNTRAGETVISVPAEVSFASGKASLSKQGRSALMAVATRLKSEFPASARFHIEGHTDSDPTSPAKFKSTRDLSIARAMAVLEYLVTEARVSDERFVVV